MLWRNNMILYRTQWRQPYVGWPVSQEPQLDLTEARAVLAKIMAL